MSGNNNDTNEEFDSINLVTGEIDEDDLIKIKTKDIQSMVVAPTDWTISVLVDLLKRKKIDLQPNYQRRIAWTEPKMSRFIESLFLRLPVPQVVLAETHPGRFAVIDGKQRVNSIARFCLDTEKPLRLQKCEYRKELNGLTYEDIERDPNLESTLDAFQSHTVRTTVIKNWGTDELLYLLFLRLNQNSVTLSAQELRRALYPGDFMNWLDDKTANSKGMKTIFVTVPDFRMRDMEVTTRHLAFQQYAHTYSGNMKQFLDNATNELAKNWPQNQPVLEEEWDKYEAAIELTRKIFGAHAFQSRSNGRYQSAKNRAVMDIMTYYFAITPVHDAALLHMEAIKNAFEALCDKNKEFSSSLQVSTKTTTATTCRFHAWGDTLRSLIGSAIPMFPLPRPKVE